VEKSAQFGLIKTELRFSLVDLQSLGIGNLGLNFSQDGRIWLDLSNAEPVLEQVRKASRAKIALARASKRLHKEISSTEEIDEIEKRILDMSAQEWTLKTKQAYEAYKRTCSKEEQGQWDFPGNPNALISTSDGISFLKKLMKGEIMIPPLIKDSLHGPPSEKPQKVASIDTPTGVPLAPVASSTGGGATLFAPLPTTK
jgi:hypothetical protein